MAKIKKDVASFGSLHNGWRIATGGIGDRSVYQGNWAFRSTGAIAGIYANNSEEAVQSILAVDSQGNPPDCSKNRYTLTFPSGGQPPVDAFWSVTMYDAKTQLLVENPIHRYLHNSPMLPRMKLNADGSLSLFVQHDSPGKD